MKAVSRALLVSLLGCAAAALGNSIAKGAPLNLGCVPDDEKSSSERSPVSTSSVRVEGRRWSVEHFASDGSTYDRTKEFAWSGASNSKSELAWTGVARGRPDRTIVGTVYSKDGEYFYREIVAEQGQTKYQLLERCEDMDATRAATRGQRR
jgi:hypothetical protein